MSKDPNPNLPLSPRQTIQFNFLDPTTLSPVILSPSRQLSSNQGNSIFSGNNPFINSNNSTAIIPLSPDSHLSTEKISLYDKEIKSYEDFLKQFETNNKRMIYKKDELDKKLEALNKYIENVSAQRDSIKKEIRDLEMNKKELEDEIVYKEKLKIQMKNDLDAHLNEKERSKVYFEPQNRATVDYNLLEKDLKGKIEFNEQKIREVKFNNEKKLKEARERYENEIQRVSKNQAALVKAIKGKEEQIKHHKVRISFQKMFKVSENTEPSKPELVKSSKPKLEFKVQEQEKSVLSLESFYLILGVLFGILLKICI
jgi:septal ring factor EnvC (AmiA/AmiB activator)